MATISMSASVTRLAPVGAPMSSRPARGAATCAARPNGLRPIPLGSASLRVSLPHPLALRSARGPVLRRSTDQAEEAPEDSATPPLVVKMTGEELEVAIQSRDRPLLVDFYATWCGPCVLMAKELESVAKELGPERVQIVKVDTDEEPGLSTQLQIEGLPTLVFIGTNPEKPALRTEGLLPAATIKEIIQNEL